MATKGTQERSSTRTGPSYVEHQASLVSGLTADSYTSSINTSSSGSYIFPISNYNICSPTKDRQVPFNQAFATAISDYESDIPGELSLHKGDVIRIIEMKGAWWSGMIEEEVGIFPSASVELNSLQETATSQSPPRSQRKSTLAKVKEACAEVPTHVFRRAVPTYYYTDEEEEEEEESEDDGTESIIEDDDVDQYMTATAQMIAETTASIKLQKEGAADTRAKRRSRKISNVSPTHSLSSFIKTTPSSNTTRKQMLVGVAHRDARAHGQPTASENEQEQEQETDKRSTVGVESKLPLPVLRSVYGTQALVELLFLKPGLSIPVVFVQQLINDKSKVKLRASEAILAFFEHISPVHTLNLLKIAIASEVEKSESANTLFRGRSIANLMMSHYRMMIGSDYLSSIVMPILDFMATVEGSFELDPDHITDANEKSLSKIHANAERLKSLMKTIISSIENNNKNFPLQFKILCRFLGKVGAKRFPDAPFVGVINFMFLRYICLAIAKPAALLKSVKRSDRISIEQRRKNDRGLVLASKVLQRLVNGQDQSSVESWMAPMTQWAAEASNTIQRIMREWMTPPESTINITDFVGARMMSKEDALESLVKAMIECEGTMFIEALGTRHYNQVFQETIIIPQDSLLRAVINYVVSDFPTTSQIAKSNSIVLFFMSLISQSQSILTSIIECLARQDAVTKHEVGMALVTIIESTIATPIPSSFVKYEPVHSVMLMITAAEYDWTFDSSSLTIAMITRYSQLSCTEFYDNVVLPVVEKIIQSDDSFDFEKGISFQKTKKANAKRLIEKADIILNSIFDCLHLLPSKLWHFFHYLAVDKGQVVAPLVAAGIICPAIEQPDQFLPDRFVKKIPSSSRKALSLLSAVIKHIFSEDLYVGKGPGYSVVNEFIQWRGPSVTAQVYAWASGAKIGKDEGSVSLTLQDDEAALALVLKFVRQNIAEIESFICVEPVEHWLIYKLHDLYLSAAKLPIVLGAAHEVSESEKL